MTGQKTDLVQGQVTHDTHLASQYHIVVPHWATWQFLAWGRATSQLPKEVSGKPFIGSKAAALRKSATGNWPRAFWGRATWLGLAGGCLLIPVTVKSILTPKQVLSGGLCETEALPFNMAEIFLFNDTDTAGVH